MSILIILLSVYAVFLTVKSWSDIYKISYYEAKLELLRDNRGIDIGESYESIKNDFWAFIK